jgi:hypothetical protein
MPQGSDGFDRHRLRRGLDAHEAKELGSRVHEAGRQFYVPYANPGGPFRELQEFGALPEHSCKRAGILGHDA